MNPLPCVHCQDKNPNTSVAILPTSGCIYCVCEKHFIEKEYGQTIYTIKNLENSIVFFFKKENYVKLFTELWKNLKIWAMKQHYNPLLVQVPSRIYFHGRLPVLTDVREMLKFNYNGIDNVKTEEILEFVLKNILADCICRDAFKILESEEDDDIYEHTEDSDNEDVEKPELKESLKKAFVGEDEELEEFNYHSLDKTGCGYDACGNMLQLGYIRPQNEVSQGLCSFHAIRVGCYKTLDEENDEELLLYVKGGFMILNIESVIVDDSYFPYHSDEEIVPSASEEESCSSEEEEKEKGKMFSYETDKTKKKKKKKHNYECIFPRLISILKKEIAVSELPLGIFFTGSPFFLKNIRKMFEVPKEDLKNLYKMRNETKWFNGFVEKHSELFDKLPFKFGGFRYY